MISLGTNLDFTFTVYRILVCVIYTLIHYIILLTNLCTSKYCLFPLLVRTSLLVNLVTRLFFYNHLVREIRVVFRKEIRDSNIRDRSA